jgi:hypothetical protein
MNEMTLVRLITGELFIAQKDLYDVNRYIKPLLITEMNIGDDSDNGSVFVMIRFNPLFDGDCAEINPEYVVYKGKPSEDMISEYQFRLDMIYNSLKSSGSITEVVKGSLDKYGPVLEGFQHFLYLPN